jgi:hypothetical protein
MTRFPQRWLSILLLLLLPTISRGQTAADLQQAQELRTRAVVLHRAGKLGEALARVKEALALTPGDKALREYQAQLEPLAAQETLDRHALQAPPEAEQSIASLAKYLVQPARSERDKARLVYRWLTDRVAYDADSYFSGKLGDVSAEAVLRSRKSVCAGYADLFEKLATQAGLNAVTVDGYAKGYGFQPGEDVADGNHAWNAVRLDGTWHLLDATWGAGHLDGKDYVKQFSNFYFLTPPAQLVFTHLPEDPKWQLLAPPVPRAEFRKWPKVDRDLFELGVSVKDIRAKLKDDPGFACVKVWQRPGPKVTILEAPLQQRLRQGLRLVVRIEAAGIQEMAFINEEKWTTLKKNGNVFEGSVVPRKGVLSVSGRPIGGDDRYWGVLEYNVE